jgi:hypothetical protein
MALTRFKDARSGKDGPVSGAIIVIPAYFDDIANSETAHFSWSPPAGMKVEIVDIYVVANTVTSDPALTVGTALAGTQIVAATNVTKTLGSLTLKSNAVTAGDTLDVRIVADGTDAAEAVSATITAYVSAPPTSLEYR